MSFVSFVDPRHTGKEQKVMDRILLSLSLSLSSTSVLCLLKPSYYTMLDR